MLSFDFKTGDVGNFVKQFKELNLTQQAAILTSKNFTEAQKNFLAKSAGVTLTTNGQVVATNTLSASQTTATATTGGLSAAFTGLSVAIKSAWSSMIAFIVANPYIAAIAGIGIALTGALLISDKFIETYDEASEKAKESADAYNTTKSELESLDSELKTTESRLKELQKLQDDGTITVAEEEELKRLQVTNEELQREYDIKKKLAELQKEQANKDAENALNKLDASVASTYDDKGNKYHEGSKIYDANVQGMTDADALEASIEKVKEYREEIIKLQDKQANVKNQKEQANAKNQKEFDKIQKDIDKYQSAIDDMESDMGTRAQNISDNLQSISNKDSELYKKNSKVVEEYLNMNSSSTADELERINDALKDTLSFTEALSGIQSLSTGLDQLDKIYADVKDGEYFDFSSILNNKEFTEAFGGLGESYENFIKTITNSPSDINACQQAFNDLATAYVYNSKELHNVTEETKASTVEMLKQMGVVNAEEVVTKQLAINTANLADAQKNLNDIKQSGIDASIDLEDATASEIVSLIDEANQLGLDTDALYNYLMQKLQANQISIVTSGDTEALANLCKSLKVATKAIETYYSVKGRMESLNAELKRQTAAGKGDLINGTMYGDIMSSLKTQLAQAEKDMESYATEALTTNLSNQYNPINYTGGTTSNKGSSAKDTKETFDWIETVISRLQRTITNLGKTVSATWKSWTTRNNALAQQISAVTQEIKLQNDAAYEYWRLAESVGLGEGYKSLVRNGTLDISTITDENTINAIKQYEEYYEKYLSALDAKQDAEDELANLAQTKFDHVAKQYDDRLSVIEHETNMLNGTIDILENKGYLASAKLYDSLIQNEQERLSELESKYTSLNSAMSGISQGTEQWYEMYSEVLSVKEEIQDATNAMIEFNNSVRDLEWEVFDVLQERMSTVISEAEFFIELMSDEKMFDDNGITEHGQATLGLHAVNYNVYMQKADEYQKAIESLDEVYANDSLNQNYLERRDELLEQHRDMILSAESEKQAIKDLMSEGYDALLESMQKIIDKRNEMLSQIKDLYDYEKSISEQTKEIASLEKQLSAYQGDNSEESRATIQQIKVSLKEAKENLQETEYDKYISDQQQMLDLLQEETEMWINERLDNEDLLLQGVIDSINGDSGSIRETLQTEAKEIGTTLSDKMESIFSPNGTFTSVVSTYSGQFTNKLTTVNDTLTQIKNLVDHMVKDADAEATKQQAQISKPATSTPSTSGGSSSSSSSGGSSSSSSGKAGWEQYLIYKADSYPKSKLNINSSIVDRLKYNNFASDFNTRAKLYNAMGGSGTYVGSSSQNVFMINKMKSAGYKVGSSRIPYNQSNWIHEDELVYRASDGGLLMPLGSGDKVFTKEMSDKLWNMAKMDFRPVLPSYDLSNLGVRGIGDSNIGDITFDIKMYGVNDVHEMAEQIKNVYQNNVGNLRKTIKTDIYGGMMGKNSLNRYKY